MAKAGQKLIVPPGNKREAARMAADLAESDTTETEHTDAAGFGFRRDGRQGLDAYLAPLSRYGYDPTYTASAVT